MRCALEFSFWSCKLASRPSTNVGPLCWLMYCNDNDFNDKKVTCKRLLICFYFLCIYTRVSNWSTFLISPLYQQNSSKKISILFPTSKFAQHSVELWFCPCRINVGHLYGSVTKFNELRFITAETTAAIHQSSCECLFWLVEHSTHIHQI